MGQSFETVTDKRALTILEKGFDERNLLEVQYVLQAPTPLQFVEWVGVDVRDDGKGNSTALAIAYADVRFFQKRLDEAVGMFNWQSDLKMEGGLLVVGLGIHPPKTASWMWKWDTGQEKSDLSEESGSGFGGGKGLFSSSFKRAGYQWGVCRDLYEFPKPRCRCRTYKGRSAKPQFGGWIDNPTVRMSESGETGRPHATQVDDPTDHIPPTANSFYTIAYARLKYDRETAAAILANFRDEATGDYDYDKAIRSLEEGLPENQRAFTKQEAEVKANGG